MRANRADTPLRAMGLALALFAITLNFLQPLAHAALMRDGAPSTLWSVFCDASGAGAAHKDSAPTRAVSHECCLGLAHATAFAEPPTAFIFVERVASVAAPLLPAEQLTPVGIRDGPSQPRGPPLLG